jgi:hypothetical protein
MARKRTELGADEGAEFFDTYNQEAPTIPQSAAPEIDDPVGSYGVDLRASEWHRLDAIAVEIGVTRHKVATWALRSFLEQYEAGEIQTVKKPRYRVCKMLSNEVQFILLSTYFKIFDKPKQKLDW